MDGHFIRGCLHGGRKILESRLGHRKPTQIVQLFLREMLCIVILAAGTMNYIDFEVFHNRSAQR